MKIDRVLLVWDGNPFYAGFYPMHMQLWSKLGIKTGLVFVSDGKNAHLIPKTGDVRVVEDKSTVPFTPPPGRSWKATMAIIHGPRLFPGEVIMVTGLDQFPASRKFINAVAEVPDDEFASCIGDVSHVTTNHAAAHHNIWSRIMAPAPTDFTELIEWTWAKGLNVDGHRDANQKTIAIGWGSDEVLFAQLVRDSGVPVRTLFKDPWEQWLNRVLGITQIVPDPKKLKDGFYSELHIRLPMAELDRNTFNTLLEIFNNQ
ncbi:MAG: hypothetical protein V4563_14590 [Pseudomonadota bacterium]